MKRDYKMQDVIAFIFVLTFCLSIFLPESFVSNTTMEQFERILGTVIGFYFGTQVRKEREF